MALPTGSNGDLITNDGTNWVAKSPVINTIAAQQVQSRDPYLAVNYVIALQGIFPSRSSADPFIAEIMIFAGNFAPRGWAFCDGQLLPISSYQALFSLIGTTYGGDGRSTFGLPDLRGRTAVHEGSGPGLSNIRLGQRGGSETIIIPAHTHTITYE